MCKKCEDEYEKIPVDIINYMEDHSEKILRLVDGLVQTMELVSEGAVAGVVVDNEGNETPFEELPEENQKMVMESVTAIKRATAMGYMVGFLNSCGYTGKSEGSHGSHMIMQIMSTSLQSMKHGHDDGTSYGYVTNNRVKH